MATKKARKTRSDRKFNKAPIIKGQQVTLFTSNTGAAVIMDKAIYEKLQDHELVKKYNFFAKLREHSSGCVVFQQTYKVRKKLKTETVYLHKMIAELYVKGQAPGLVVGCVDGNKKHCSITNLIWRSRSAASRTKATTSKSGYTGVYVEGNRYRANITIDKKTHHIGMFETAEEAAMAYNKRSREVFKEHARINIIDNKK